MLASLKYIGIANAAVWLGTVVFYCLGVGPAFSSDEMARLLPRSHSGAASLVVLGWFYGAQCVFGMLSLLHLLTEWLYAGRPLRKWQVYLLAGLLSLNLLGAFWLQPKMRGLNLEAHGRLSTRQQSERAEKSLSLWYGFSGVISFITFAGLAGYLWNLSNQPGPMRFVSSNKFRG